MKRSTRRVLGIAVLGAFIALGALAENAVLAVDGKLIVKIHEANVIKKNNDAIGSEQQDLYVCSSIDQSPALISASKQSNRDHASWSPPGYNDKLVPGKNQRYFDVYLELWDDDTNCLGCGDDEAFDTSQQNGPPPPLINNHLSPCSYVNIPTGSFPHIQYDVCTGQMELKGVNGSAWLPLGANSVTLDGRNTSSGTIDNWATLSVEVAREPSNWLPDDVSLTAEIVQSVYHATHAVHDKETSLILRISSTYPFFIQAPVVGVLSDGTTTVADTRTVWIYPGSEALPGETLVALFDGTGAPPFKPQKSFLTGTGTVTGWGRVDYQETISPNAPVQLMDCANENNVATATELPLMHSSDLLTVYEPFDYEEDKNFISSGQLDAMFTREENLRIASWPLASLNSSKNYNQAWKDHGGSFLCPFEPLCTLLVYNIGAAMAGIDRLVLSTRQGWFSQNAFRHQFIAPSSGYSLGAFAPRAVLAEDGYYGVAVHELGHTYALSQHQCKTGGVFGICFDEYNHRNPPDDNPYEAMGYDVRAGAFPMQQVYPNGYHPGGGTPLQCPTTPPQGRDICAFNIMDVVTSGGYTNWLDTFTFNYLLLDQLPHSDPFVVNVSGLIHLPGGEGDGTVPPSVAGFLNPTIYQFMGIEDFPVAPLSSSGEQFSGLGPFRIRMVTAGGVRDYRLLPRMFRNEPQPDLAGGFSINVPWDPRTTAIQLVSPSDLRDQTCWGGPCRGSDLILAEIPVTPMPPQASGLRAGRDVPAPPPMPGAPPSAPTIGPGHSAVLSWESFDADSPALHGALILVMNTAAGGAGGTQMPVTLDITGNTYTIPHARMADAPGTYAGRLLVSDGVNTTELYQGPLFTICNLSNGGVEACNGLDDDCDGIVDNAVQPGPINDVTLNPQPFPPAPGTVMSWSADPSAQTYDVVYGSLLGLHDPAGGFATAMQGCLADNINGTSVQLNPQPLPPREGYWFLVRGSNCGGHGSYDSGSASQTGSRDAGINGSPMACP